MILNLEKDLLCACFLLPVCIHAFVPGILALDLLELWLRTVVNCCLGAETHTWRPLQRAEGAPNY